MNVMKREQVLPRGSFRGSFTVEAAVVIPIAMVLIAAVIYISFLAHDAVTLTAVGEYALLSFGDRETGGSSEEMQELLHQNLITSGSLQVSLTENKKQMTASISAEYPILFPGLSLFSGQEPVLRSVLRISHRNGRLHLLPCKALADGAKGILKQERTQS